jgi:hypothetical protein
MPKKELHVYAACCACVTSKGAGFNYISKVSAYACKYQQALRMSEGALATLENGKAHQCEYKLVGLLSGRGTPSESPKMSHCCCKTYTY